MVAGIIFMVVIIAAAFSSADSALTALTTSFCIDILKLPSRKNVYQNKVRLWVHVGFTLAVFFTIVLFDQINVRSVVTAVFIVGGFTYGLLLVLFSFGLTYRFCVRYNLL